MLWIVSLWCLLGATNTAAQVSPLQRGYYTIGINGGWSYQSSDVQATLDGFGLGLTVGKNLLLSRGAGAAFDVRGRLLYARQYGLDSYRSFDIENNRALNGSLNLNYLNYPAALNEPRGFVYQNHRTDVGELAAEGVLSFRGRNTPVLFSLFGGIGLDWYRTRIDQADELGREYYADYSLIDRNQSRRRTRNELRQILDGTYETVADGQGNAGALGLMPSLGVELGFLVTPRFALMAGHRVTFSGTNTLDGQQWADPNNDWYHYTSIGLQWYINPRNRQKLRPPVINIQEPRQNEVRVRSNVAPVRATIQNINSAADVQYIVNGQPLNFDFRNQNFNATTFLRPGRNEVTIIATNAAGSDRKRVVFFLEDPGGVVPPPGPNPSPNPNPNPYPTPPASGLPVIQFINPPADNFASPSTTFALQATVTGVADRRNVQLFLNGRALSNFNYSGDNLTGQLTLQQGSNEVRIRASNSAGLQEANRTIIVNGGPTPVPVPGPTPAPAPTPTPAPAPPASAPVVRITNPASSPFVTNSQQITIRASIEGVRNRNQIQLQVNNQDVSDFNFSGNSFTATLNLRPGQTNVIIRAQTEGGRAEDRTVINYDRPTPAAQAPVVQINEPAHNSTASDARIRFRASTQHVTAKNQLTLRVNDRVITNFTFNGRDGSVTANLTLAEGNNIIELSASTPGGSDQARAQVVFNLVVISNPPVVRIQAPANNSNTENATANLRASVERVTKKEDITIRVNGNPLTNFTYDTRNSLVTASVRLEQGDNEIVVRAQNRDGNDQASVRVNYNAPAPKPTVRITEPTRSGTVVTNARIAFQARIEHVRNKSGVTLTLNGTTMNDFNFDAQTGMLNTGLNLREGSNTIVVQGTNGSGSEQASLEITLRTRVDPISANPKPEISNIVTSQPASNPLNPNVASSSLSAQVEHVANPRLVRVFVNGQEVQSSFNTRTRALSATLALTRGTNTILIRAQNDEGVTEETRVITF